MSATPFKSATDAAVRVRGMGFETLPPSVLMVYLTAARVADLNGVFTMSAVAAAIGRPDKVAWVWQCVIRLASAGLVEAMTVSVGHRRYRIPPTRLMAPEELSRERDAK